MTNSGKTLKAVKAALAQQLPAFDALSGLQGVDISILFPKPGHAEVKIRPQLREWLDLTDSEIAKASTLT